MKRTTLESLMGAVVILVAVFFFVFAYRVATRGRPFQGYTLFAQFNTVSGLHTGAEVKISGVQVGEVKTVTLDPKAYKARVVLQMVRGVALPKDSQVAVVNSSIFGGSYLNIRPGKSKVILTGGQEMKKTKDSVSLEELIGRAIFLDRAER